MRNAVYRRQRPHGLIVNHDCLAFGDWKQLEKLDGRAPAKLVASVGVRVEFREGRCRLLQAVSWSPRSNFAGCLIRNCHFPVKLGFPANRIAPLLALSCFLGVSILAVYRTKSTQKPNWHGVPHDWG